MADETGGLSAWLGEHIGATIGTAIAAAIGALGLGRKYSQLVESSNSDAIAELTQELERMKQEMQRTSHSLSDKMEDLERRIERNRAADHEIKQDLTDMKQCVGTLNILVEKMLAYQTAHVRMGGFSTGHPQQPVDG